MNKKILQGVLKAVVLEKHGGPDVLQVKEILEPQINQDEIKIKIKYAAINYAEILSRKGLYSWAPKTPYILGLESVGEVIEIGENVKNIEIGQRTIVGSQSGNYAELTKIHKDYFLPPPDYLTWEEAAAFGVAFFTSWVAMHEVARVRRKERALIQAGAGGVGVAAIQLAKVFDMDVYATGSISKKSIIEELGATFLTYETFDKDLSDLKPDYILESVGGDVFKRSFNILAPLGRLVQIGGTSIRLNKYNPISLLRAYRSLPKATIRDVLRRSRGFMGLHVGYLMSKSDLLRPMWNQMIEVCENHKLKPIVETKAIFPMSLAGEAHEYIDNRKNIGKVLLDPSK
jgi:synaptic vesicle membrane protein VAT-1